MDRMQVSMQLKRDEVFIEEPEKEDVDMEVELGVNLVDTFTNKHVNCQAPRHPICDVDSCGLLPAKWCGEGSSELDDVAQEVLSTALLEDQDVSFMEVDSTNLPIPYWGDSHTGKLEMVVYLYAFEKFSIVYA